MSIAKFLKDQKEFLTNATKEIEKRQVKAEDLEFPTKFKESREEDIKDRIDTLKKQKEETIKRYDRAIAEQEKELDRLEKQISIPGLGELSKERGGATTKGVKVKQTTAGQKIKAKTTAAKTAQAKASPAKKKAAAKKAKASRKAKKTK